MAAFPNIFRPLALNNGRVTLKNRILMGSMHVGIEEEVNSEGKLQELADYFEARAKGDVGLIVTGGIAPNNAGRVKYFAAKLEEQDEVFRHKCVTEAVHRHDGKILMQILHAGRYGYSHSCVAPSKIKSPISMFTPSALSGSQVEQTIDDFVKSAELAAEAGYDGVEVMGSEGYLINQFITSEANKRTDEWGGSYENRIRFPIEIVKRTRKAVGEDFILMYRLSMLDLVQGGSTWEEIVQLAQEIESAGASIINTGIGWHQARVPTIATAVPRGGFSFVTKNLMGQVQIPLCTTNRINMPSTAEEILSENHADMVSMARPFLADPEFLIKAKEGRVDEINTCIGCNQACLDHVFQSKRASCLVNPAAGYEAQLELKPIDKSLANEIKVAVVGAGPAGLACAVSCGKRGIQTTLFEKENSIGGQFNLAKRVPGKEEFFETLRYFQKQLELHSDTIDVKMNTKVDNELLQEQGFTHVVVSTGVAPRKVKIPGSDHPKVLGYTEVLSGLASVGKRVAVIGAGGIGFDVCEYLTDPHGRGLTEKGPDPGLASTESIEEFCDEWKIDKSMSTRGGLANNSEGKGSSAASNNAGGRQVFMLQRSKGKVGGSLAKTTGWIKRTQLKHRGVEMLKNVKYEKIDDAGLHITVKGAPRLLEVDNVVICAGQTAERHLWDTKPSDKVKYFVIGGAERAAEVDAKRAFDQGTRLASQIETAKTGDVFNQPETLTSKLFIQLQKFLQ